MTGERDVRRISMAGDEVREVMGMDHIEPYRLLSKDFSFSSA